MKTLTYNIINRTYPLFYTCINVTRTNSADYKFVNLGLPSGTMWATKNIGAKTETDYGLYFAWGETKGHALKYDGEIYDFTDDKTFTFDDYDFGQVNYQDKINRGMSKYNGTDNKTNLESVDDAATNINSKWQIPTSTLCIELVNYTTLNWEEVNGVYGLRFISEVNGNSIFFPGSGKVSEGVIYCNGDCDFYCWTSSLDPYCYNAKCMIFAGESHGVEYQKRCNGCIIRPVYINNELIYSA